MTSYSEDAVAEEVTNVAEEYEYSESSAQQPLPYRMGHHHLPMATVKRFVVHKNGTSPWNVSFLWIFHWIEIFRGSGMLYID